ncbi:hypothetical protein VNO80_20889 [Phaseolus coccineus]|uniref:Uncharacterized protein n=1 Tax=Phaseolus coccineus TaxID=3886 RepID=A0AAN9QTK2_PHACN
MVGSTLGSLISLNDVVRRMIPDPRPTMHHTAVLRGLRLSTSMSKKVSSDRLSYFEALGIVQEFKYDSEVKPIESGGMKDNKGDDLEGLGTDVVEDVELEFFIPAR